MGDFHFRLIEIESNSIEYKFRRLDSNHLISSHILLLFAAGSYRSLPVPVFAIAIAIAFENNDDNKIR